MGVSFDRMTAEEYPRFKSESIRLYVAEKARAESLTSAEAEEVGRKTVETFLGDGLETRDNHFFTIHVEGRNEGWIWLAVQGKSSVSRRMYIYDLYLSEAIRGKGYGRRAMRFIEEETLRLGVGKVGLHVFGHNRVARELYESEGYRPVSIVMEKDLVSR